MQSIQPEVNALREKYKNQLSTKSQEFENYLQTINRQIKDIENLVNEFSSFARMPRPILKKIDLIQKNFKTELASAINDSSKINDLHNKYLSRKGLLSQLFSDLGKASSEDKPVYRLH